MDLLFCKSLILLFTSLFLQTTVVVSAEGNKGTDTYNNRWLLWLSQSSSGGGFNPPSNNPADPVKFVNLDVTINVETNVDIGDVVYSLSTDEPNADIDMLTQSTLFHLDGNYLKTKYCLSVGHTEMLDFRVTHPWTPGEDFGFLYIVVVPMTPTFFIPNFVEIVTDSLTVDVTYVNFTTPGACVEFHCHIDCLSCGMIGGGVFWMGSDYSLRADVASLQYDYIYWLVVTCADAQTTSFEGSNSAQIKVKFFPVPTAIPANFGLTTADRVPDFVNLDASITISSSVEVGDTVFTVSATEGDAHIGMQHASQYFDLNHRNGAVTTKTCLPPGLTEVLEFHIIDTSGNPGPPSFLDVTVDPTVPEYDMHNTVDVEVDLLKDIVDVFTIEYEDPGGCVAFRCLVSSFNYPNQQFWVLYDNTVLTTVSGIDFYNPDYELSVVCSDTGSDRIVTGNFFEVHVQFQAISMTTTTQTVVTSRTSLPRTTQIPDFLNLDTSINISSSVEVGDTVFTVSATDGDAHIGMQPASQYFDLNHRNGAVSTKICLPPGLTEVLEFHVIDTSGTPGPPSFLDVTVDPAVPEYDMHNTVDVEVDLLKDIVDVFTIEYEDPGGCVAFRCLVSSFNYPNQQFWVLYDNTVQTTVSGIDFNSLMYELSVVCSDTGSDIIVRENFFKVFVLFQATSMTTTTQTVVTSGTSFPRTTQISVADFENLDASLNISTSVEVGDTVFTVSAADFDAHIGMQPASQYFDLNHRNGAVTTKTCLPPGLTEVLEFHVIDTSGTPGPPSFLHVTVDPTIWEGFECKGVSDTGGEIAQTRRLLQKVPEYDMHNTVDVEVDLWNDIVDVFTIEYEDPGGCVGFRCFVSSLNYPNQQFWVLYDNTVQTTVSGIDFDSPVYELSVVCSDTGSDIIVQENFFEVDVLFQAISMTTTTQTVVTSRTSLPRTTQSPVVFLNLDANITVSSNLMVGSVLYTISLVDVNMDIYLNTDTDYFTFSQRNVMTRNCLPTFYMEDLEFVYRTPNTTATGTLSITVSPTKPRVIVPSLVDVYADGSGGSSASLEVFGIEFANGGECVSFTCTVKCVDKYFWIEYGSLNQLGVIIRTFSNDIHFETLYTLDLRCYDNGVLGVMDMFVTQTDVDVRFIWRSVSTMAVRVPTSSGGTAPITSSERSTSTHVTYETTTDESHASVGDETQNPLLTKSVSTSVDPVTSSYRTSASVSPLSSSSAESTASFSNLLSFSSETSTSTVSDAVPTTPTPFKQWFKNLDASITVSSREFLGAVVYSIIPNDPYIPVLMLASSQYFGLTNYDVVVVSCLPAGHMESLYFSQFANSPPNGNYSHTKRSTRRDIGVLNITVIPTKPELSIRPFVGVIVDRSQGQSSTSILNVTEIDFENGGDCVSFTCLIKSADKEFWVSEITYIGSASRRRYMVQTYSNDINYEILYILDLRCYDNGTLGVTNYDTQANTVVRFVTKDVSTTTDKFPITSSLDFSTNSFESSTYTNVDITDKVTAFSSSVYPSSYLESTTVPTTVSSPELTTAVEDFYINLDANITVSSSQNIGDVVYTILTYDPYGIFDMKTHSSYFKLANHDVVVAACLPAGHSESLLFDNIHRRKGSAVGQATLSITVAPTIPDLYIQSSVDVFVGRSLGQSSIAILDVTEIYTENGGDCVSFTCMIKCTDKEFWVSQITYWPIDIYENLDANISISSSQNIGDVVYTVLTYDPYEYFGMITHSSYFKLVSHDVVVDACLPAGHSESLVFDSIRKRRGFVVGQGVLNITVAPTVPVIGSPISDSVVFITLPLPGLQVTDTINVTDIKLENLGGCVSFLCSAISPNNRFWVTGSTVATSIQDIKPNFRYNLYLICGDGSADQLANRYVAQRKLYVVFVQDTTTSLTSSVKPLLSSSTKVTLPQLLTSAAIKKTSEAPKVPSQSTTNHDKMKLTRTDFSFSEIISTVPSTLTTSVHIITSIRQSTSFITTTDASLPYSITTSVFTTNRTPMNSHGQTDRKSFFDEPYNLFLVTSVCGGMAGLAVLSALISVIYKRACTGSISAIRSRGDNEDARNNSPFTLSSSSANSSSRLIRGSPLTPVDI